MLIIPIILRNIQLVMAVNNGQYPPTQFYSVGVAKRTYLVMKEGEPNRIVDDETLAEITLGKHFRTMNCELSYAW